MDFDRTNNTHCAPLRCECTSTTQTLDAVSILAFASLNGVEDYLISLDHDAIAASEASFCGDGSE